MKISKRQLKRIIRESMEDDYRRMGNFDPDSREMHAAPKQKQQAMMSVSDFQEQIEWGDWSGRPPSFEWDYVEQEGSQDLRFDWRGGSMFYRAYSPPGEIEGNVPKHLIQHLEKMGIQVYEE